MPKNVRLALAAVLMLSGRAGLAAQPAEPLLSGFNPDPSICRVGEDYYLVTSSFMLWPGVPVYHSKDLRHWEVVSHAWSYDDPEYNSYTGVKGRNDDDGIWAPTIRYHAGTFYVSVTYRGKGAQANYIVTAKSPKGPWSRPIRVDAEWGIDASLFFDAPSSSETSAEPTASVWYHSNRTPKPQAYRGQCLVWAQKVDPATGKLYGERYDLTNGVGKEPRLAEGPHLYKIDGRYYLMVAQGGTGFNHAAGLLVADKVEGPYVEMAKNPLITAEDLGKESPLQALGHADLVDTPEGKWYAVCLGKRSQGPKKLAFLGRETFLCPVTREADGNLVFHRDQLLKGEWSDPTNTRYGLLSHRDWKAELIKVKTLEGEWSVDLKPGETVVLYRSDNAYYGAKNETGRPAVGKVVVKDCKVTVLIDNGVRFKGPIEPLCERKDERINRFNGLMFGKLTNH